MSNEPVPQSIKESLKRLAGYLNFSGGSDASDITALWNEVYQQASHGNPLTGTPAWLVLHNWIEETLSDLATEQSAFSNCDQARTIARLLLSELLPAYMMTQ